MKDKVIELGNMYYLEMEQYNFILHYNQKSSMVRGKPQLRYTHSWYYNKLRPCLEKYMEMELKPCNDVPELLDRLEWLETKITELCLDLDEQLKQLPASTKELS